MGSESASRFAARALLDQGDCRADLAEAEGPEVDVPARRCLDDFARHCRLDVDAQGAVFGRPGARDATATSAERTSGEQCVLEERQGAAAVAEGRAGSQLAWCFPSFVAPEYCRHGAVDHAKGTDVNLPAGVSIVVLRRGGSWRVGEDIKNPSWRASNTASRAWPHSKAHLAATRVILFALCWLSNQRICVRKYLRKSKKMRSQEKNCGPALRSWKMRMTANVPRALNCAAFPPGLSGWCLVKVCRGGNETIRHAAQAPNETAQTNVYGTHLRARRRKLARISSSVQV